MGEEQNILKGRVAIVTGAGRGIGKGIAKKLAEAGAKMVAADIDSVIAQETSDELNEQGKNCISVKVDVTKIDSVKSLLAKTM